VSGHGVRMNIYEPGGFDEFRQFLVLSGSTRRED